MTITQLPPRPLQFGDRVGHRDPGTWGKYVPGRVVAVDTHQDPPRVRVHPTYRHSPDWEAHPDDLIRIGRNPHPAGYGLRGAVTGPSRECVAAETRSHRPRCQRFTADGIRWDVPDNDLPHGTPRQ